MIGAEGIGLYQAAFSFYGLIFVVISGGLPTALALSTAKDASRSWVLFKIISVLVLILGGIVSLLTFWYSNSIATFIGYPDLGLAIRYLSPAIFVVPLLNVLRGYLQGKERFKIIAFSEIAEQLVRVASIIIVVPLFISGGLASAVGGSVIGTFAGALIAFFLITVILASTTQTSVPDAPANHQTSSTRSTLLFLMKTSLAITFTRLLIPVSDFVDTLLIPKRLITAGYTASEAIEIFGVMTGMAIILVYVPTILTAALSHTMTIRIAADWQEGRILGFNQRITAAFKITWYWGLACGVFLYLYGPELSIYLFGTIAAGQPIQLLAILPLLVGLREISTSILWAKNQKKAPIIGLVFGIMINIFLIYILVSIPGLGYRGISICIIAMELIAVLWNLQALKIFRAYRHHFVQILFDVLIFAGITISVIAFRSFFSGIPFGNLIAKLLGLFSFFIFTGLYIKIRCANVSKSFDD